MLDESICAAEYIERAATIDGRGFVEFKISMLRGRHVPLRGFGGSHVL